MFVSEARISANRRNSLKSTGPKTAEGKERSRANALKHGLCSTVVVAEDAQLVQQRAEEFYNTLRPQNHFHCWLVSEAALLSIRINRSERMERRVRDKIALGAELFWEDDRRLEAARLGGTLGNNPDEVVEQLRKTPQGCEWLIARWALLAHAADVKGGWSTAQEQLAFDLLGTPALFREGFKPGAVLDSEGRVVESSDDPSAVARREVAELKARRDLVEGLDQASRTLAESDLADDQDPELRRLRRYESTLHRRLKWCLDQLRYQSPLKEPLRGLMHSWLGQHEPPPEAEPMPEPQPQPEGGWVKSVHPPFDLTPEECPPLGEEVDIPKILANRRDQKLKKAEARRDTRRRKLEKLRA